MFSCTVKEPVGVVGAIIPWNNPIGASMWKIGPALATGCTVVLKPAEEASLSCLRLGELILEAGVPPGVVNIVTGFGETAGAALAAHPGVDKLSFTGSHLTGQKIVRASAGNLKRLALELGGKSPDIVFADADLDAAVPGAAMAIFANSGQICSAGSRLFVERPIYDEFVHRVAEYGKALRVGRGTDHRHADRTARLEAAARARHRLSRHRRARRRQGPVGRSASDRRRLCQRLFRSADRVRRRPRRHAHLPGGDLRSGGLRDSVRHRRRSDQARERNAVRPRQRRVDARRRDARCGFRARCARARSG